MSPNSPNLSSLRLPPSLKDLALASIKEAILSKTMEPGVIYTEASVANELGISRTPVREALIHLASKGFLTLLPRKGFRLKVLTQKDISDLFEFRGALETAVIRQITPILTEESMNHIGGLLIKHRKAAEAGDPIASVRADREFHLYLASLTGNSYLIAAIEEIRDLIDLAGVKTLEFKERRAESLREHQAIVEMLKAGSASGAVEKMEEHIRITEQRALARIEAVE